MPEGEGEGRPSAGRDRAPRADHAGRPGRAGAKGAPRHTSRPGSSNWRGTPEGEGDGRGASFGDRKSGPARSGKPTGSTSKRAGKRPPGAVRRGELSMEDLRTQPSAKRPSAARKSFKGPEGTWRTRKPKAKPDGDADGRVRLNRYLAQSGICSRREADDLIQAGVVTVNGVVVTELGTKVAPHDKVQYAGQRLSMEKKRYVLLNKPKGFITTTDDPRERRTVMQLVANACPERIYPVGRLDRATTGVLLLTNDGDLAKRLTHPSHGAEKIYHVTLDKAVTKAHLNQLLEGVVLEDGPAQADEASHVEGASKREVGIKLHSGRNRIVRRMFEHLGYEVIKLDRVVFGGLTKKDLPRGTWRLLTEKEVLFLTKRK